MVRFFALTHRLVVRILVAAQAARGEDLEVKLELSLMRDDRKDIELAERLGVAAKI